MSYVLACWVNPAAGTDPVERWEQLEDAEQTDADPRVVAFVNDLTERWPDGDDMDEDVSPWADMPIMENASGEMVLLAIVHSMVDDAFPVIVATAEAHGLQVFDPAAGLLVLEWVMGAEGGAGDGPEGVVVPASTEDVRARLEQAFEDGQACLQVVPLSRDYPLVTVSVLGEHVVIHGFVSDDQCLLLRGDGAVAPEDAVEGFLIEGEELGAFTGDFISSHDSAIRAVDAFLESRDLQAMGAWERL